MMKRERKQLLRSNRSANAEGGYLLRVPEQTLYNLVKWGRLETKTDFKVLTLELIVATEVTVDANFCVMIFVSSEENAEL